MDAGSVNQLVMVYVAYLIATASPGPSNMAIMGVAMSRGRRPALRLAMGVVAGSQFWAILAATGLSTILTAYANFMTVIRILGGLYLIYLAVRSARSALSPYAPAGPASPADSPPDHRALFCRGALLHLMNPKAVLAWIAIMSLGLRPDAPAHMVFMILGGCAILGVFVFGGYALAFSSSAMAGLYQRARRWIEGTLAIVFGYAGLRLLTSRA